MADHIRIQDFKLWDKLTKKRVPVAFDLEITARCNLNCRHCYINLPAGDREALDKELTVAQIIDIARQAAELGVVWCLITGGEPLLRPDFAEIYMGLKRLGLLVSVYTNATLVNDDHIALFRKYPPRDIEVTVYGVTGETYEAITRRPGSFRKFTRGLEKLRLENVNIRLKAMAMQSNLHEQGAISEFCQVRTKDYYRFDPQLHLRFDADPLRNQEICTERLTPEQIVALEESDEKRIKYLRKNCDTLINEKLTQYKGDRLFCCGAGKSSFSVSYDGLFRLCSSLWAEGTTFDLRKGTLTDAWYNFVPRVLGLSSQRQQYLETCCKCALVNFCLWCPAHAHLETGQLDGSTPYFCEVAHKRAESIKKQVNKEK